MPCSSHTTSQNFVPICLPHWPACMRATSREETAWRQRARGRKKQERAEKSKKLRAAVFHANAGNAGRAHACIPNGGMQWFYNSNLSSCGRHAKRAGCGRVRSRNIYVGDVLVAVRQGRHGKSAKPLQQEKNNSEHVQRGRLKMNKASEFGPHTHTNRRTCPGAGL